jgi:hypothetical protein
MGASRWLDANMLAGTSMNSAMAKVTIVFSRFIKFSSGIEFVDVATSWARPPGRGATPQRFTTGFVYWIKYAQDRSLDLDRGGRTLLSAAVEVGLAFNFLCFEIREQWTRVFTLHLICGKWMKLDRPEKYS